MSERAKASLSIIPSSLRCSDRVVGGEQMFLDTLLAAEDYRKTFPHYFAILASTKATFQKIHYDRFFLMLFLEGCHIMLSTR